jgi:translocation and assembly module TamB
VTKGLKIFVVTLSLAVLVAAFGGVGWLLGTPDGARWMMNAVSKYTQYTVTADKVDGRLWGNLRLEGARLQLPGVDAGIADLHLRWHPSYLLVGKVAVTELAIKDIHIQDNRPSAAGPPELSWPRVTGIPSWFNLRIGKLRIVGLQYRNRDGKPSIADEISARVMWQGNLLTIWNIVLSTPAFHAEGAVMSGFQRPSLLMKLTVIPVRSVAGFNKITCRARLFPGGKKEQVAGPIMIAGMSGENQLLGLAGEIGVTRNSLNLRRLRLTQAGSRGAVTGSGTLSFESGGPRGAFSLAFAGIDLVRELHTTTDLSGNLNVQGNTGNYKGNFRLSNKGAGWRTGRFSGSFHGSDAGVMLTALEGDLLGGTVKGSAGVEWREGVSLRADLNFRNINPAKVTPKWNGEVNADLKANADWSRSAPPRLELSGRFLESRLHGKELTGSVDLGLSNGNLLIKQLALHGKGFEVKAQGDLRKRLVFGVEVDNLTGLIPDTAGSLKTEGWIRWRDGNLSGTINGSGRKLEADGIHTDAIDFSAMLSEGTGFPLRGQAGLRGVTYQRLKFNSVNLSVDGSLKSHTIQWVMRSTGFELQAILKGGYENKTWKGSLTRFSGHDSVGPWKLRNPSALRISADSFYLERLFLIGASGEYLEAGAQIGFHPLVGSIMTEWRGVNLARFSPLIEGGQITGSSSGAFQTRLTGLERITLTGRAEASVTAVVKGHKIVVRQSSITANWNKSGMSTLFSLTFADGGMLRGSFSSRQPARIGVPSSGRFETDWNGIDMVMIHPWLPKGLDLEGQLAGRAEGTLSPGLLFSVKGNAEFLQGTAIWKEKENQYSAVFHTAEVSWSWQGMKKAGGAHPVEAHSGRLTVKGRIDASGTALVDGRRVAVQQVSATLDWNDESMRNSLLVKLADGGMLKGSFTSLQPATMGLPSQGIIDAEWNKVDLSLLHPWLASGLDLQGSLSGRMSGNLLPDRRLDIQGSSTLSGGEVRWSRESGQLSAEVSDAEFSWTWSGRKLSGDVSLGLKEFGRIQSSFQLPMAARLPPSFEPSGPIELTLKGHVAELGILTSIFPGLIQESRGELDLDARVGGQWQNPEVSGTFKLSKAAAYLPTTGIHLKNAGLVAHFSRDQLIVDSLGIDSGPGHLGGSGKVRFKSWRVTQYEGNIKGDRFQIVYLPELQVQASPDLNFSGSPEKLTVRGQVRVPELLVRGGGARAPVQPSNDVVLAGEEKPVEKEYQLPVDIQVTVILGDKVLVNYEGIDAQLKGTLNLSMQKLDKIRSTGEIRVVKGSYKTYGINLDITRGRIYYAGGPINQPRLDIQAMRRVGDVRAGVRIAGTPATMTVKLYSEPNMPDSSILSYIVLGQPLAYNSQQTGLVTRAAGQLVTTTSAYTPIQATPPGVAPSKSTGSTLSQSMLSIGRYLTPSLYVSYGRSLLTGANLVHLRYELSKHWEVETQTGTETGGDLYFKINFK